MSEYHVPQAFETHHSNDGALSMHRHTLPYVALVLEGDYEERSVDGRYRLTPGTLVYHPPFHAHTNAFLSDQVRVLNIEYDGAVSGLEQYQVASINNLDALEQLMRDRPDKTSGAAREIFRMHSKKTETAPRWIGVLARALAMEGNSGSIKDLAGRLGVTPEHASRKFQREFGVGPSVFRREQRLRCAMAALADGATLAAAAAAAGFSDQSHMGRTIKSALGRTPRTLRRKIRQENSETSNP